MANGGWPWQDISRQPRDGYLLRRLEELTKVGDLDIRPK
jgi:hypothetical protein